MKHIKNKLDKLKNIESFKMTDEQKKIIKNELALSFWHKDLIKFRNLILQSEKIFNLADSDVDGAISGYISDRCCKKLDKEVFTYSHKSRIHGLTKTVVNKVLDENFDAIIIVDAGSNDIDLINLLLSKGVKVIVLDHHEHTNTIEHDNFVLINCQDVEGYEGCSGAFITYYSFKETFKEIIFEDYGDLIALTVVSDVCKRTPVNVQILKNFIFHEVSPSYLMNILSGGKVINTISSLVSISSNLNAITRYYGSDFLMNLILNDLEKLSYQLKYNVSIKEKNNMVINELIKLSTFYRFDNMFVCVMPSEYKSEPSLILRNYIGILANKISQMTGKISLVLLSEENNKEQCIEEQYLYCYSARDKNNLDVLFEFKNIGIKADGHGNAWGGILKRLDFDLLSKVDKNIGLNVKNKETKLNNKDNLYICEGFKDIVNLGDELLIIISVYNSLTEQDSKIGFVYELEGIIKTKRSIKFITYGEHQMHSFDMNVMVGDYIICYPEFNGEVKYSIEQFK